MDPEVLQLIKDVAELQAQVGWLTTLVNYAVGTTIATLVTTILSSTLNYTLLRRNNKK